MSALVIILGIVVYLPLRSYLLKRSRILKNQIEKLEIPSNVQIVGTNAFFKNNINAPTGYIPYEEIVIPMYFINGSSVQ